MELTRFNLNDGKFTFVEPPDGSVTELTKSHNLPFQRHKFHYRGERVDGRTTYLSLPDGDYGLLRAKGELYLYEIAAAEEILANTDAVEFEVKRIQRKDEGRVELTQSTLGEYDLSTSLELSTLKGGDLRYDLDDFLWWDGEGNFYEEHIPTPLCNFYELEIGEVYVIAVLVSGELVCLKEAEAQARTLVLN